MPLPATVIRSARSICPALLMLSAVATPAWPAEKTGPPRNLRGGVFQPVVEKMWRASPTFRGQCQRLAAAPDLIISLTADVPRSGGTVRAFTRIADTRKGRTARVVVLSPPDAVELIAHELEHVIEHLDGAERGRDACGRQHADKRYETCRAIEAGRRVAREVSEAAPRVVTLRQQDALGGPLDRPTARVSPDGRFVVFTSAAPLAGAGRGTRELYVLDLDTADIEHVSARPGWADAYDDFRHPGISRDGRVLVFDAHVRPGADGHDGTFRWRLVAFDRLSGLARDIHVEPDDDAVLRRNGAPAVSADGSTIVFESVPLPLEAETRAESGIYLARLPSAAAERVDVPPRSIVDMATDHAWSVPPPRQKSMTPAISADGRYVAFASTADPACAPAESCARRRRRGEQTMVFVRDTTAGLTIRIDRSVTGDDPNGHSYGPSLSADGRYIAFTSEASNLVKGDRNGVADVFVHDTLTGVTELVSRRRDGRPGNGPSRAPSISADGALIAFQSLASDLVCHKNCPPHEQDTNLLWDIFLVDRSAGTMVRASGDAHREWMAASRSPSLDAAGRVLVFSSRHPIDAADVMNDEDVYVQIRDE